MPAPHVSATRALQEWLRSLGRVDVVVDGVFGPKTAAANKATATSIGMMLQNSIEDLRPKVIARQDFGEDSNKYRELVKAECARQGVRYEPVAAIVGHESRWNHSARSSTTAVGLFQLTGWPVKQYNKDVRPAVPYTLDDRFDLNVNIFLGVWYIKYCAKYVDVSPMSDSAEDWGHIYGSYNLGPATYASLRQGNTEVKGVVDAWSTQSSYLKQGGITRYVNNARSLFV